MSVESQEKIQTGLCVFFWCIGAFFVLIRGPLLNLCGSNVLGLDFLTIIIAYLFIFYGPKGAGAFALGQGFLMDTFSCSVDGLFVFLYLFILALIYLGSRFFDIETAVGQIALVSLTVLMKEIMFFVLAAFFFHNFFSYNAFMWISILSVVVTGVVTPVLFRIFDRLRVS
jgi:rod shape-determining protein MreD